MKKMRYVGNAPDMIKFIKGQGITNLTRLL